MAKVKRFNLLSNCQSVTLYKQHGAGVWGDSIAVDWFIGLSFFDWRLARQTVTAGGMVLKSWTFGPVSVGSFYWPTKRTA